MDCLRLPLFVILFICVVARQSDGYNLKKFMHIAKDDSDRDFTAINEMSPSPSPSPMASLDFVNAPSPISHRPEDENCDKVFNKCEFKDHAITACVPFVGNGSEASYLLVVNNGANSVKLNFAVHPTDGILKDIEISGHQVEKVNLTLNAQGNSSISLKVGTGSCVIHLGASVPQGFYTQYVTPTYGAYLLFVVAVCVGGTWACCKLVKRRRHLDGGIPYQELEMGQQETDPSFFIETPEGWDENWDDEDWDNNANAVGSPGARKTSQNGASLKYIDTSQWGDDWDDDEA